MARQHFLYELRSIGYTPDDLRENRLAFDYVVPVGRFAGRNIRLGFVVSDDFPLSPPGGPHLQPQLLPIHPANDAGPLGGIHASPFGSDWQYWSRPHPNWRATKRTVRDYLAHIRHLFDLLQ